MLKDHKPITENEYRGGLKVMKNKIIITQIILLVIQLNIVFGNLFHEKLNSFQLNFISVVIGLLILILTYISFLFKKRCNTSNNKE